MGYKANTALIILRRPLLMSWSQTVRARAPPDEPPIVKTLERLPQKTGAFIHACGLVRSCFAQAIPRDVYPFEGN